METIYKFISALMVVVTIPATAQDRLEPCSSVLDEYRARVKEIALTEIPGNLELWVGAYRSFSSEWGIGVSVRNQRYYLTYVTFDQSLFHSSWVSIGPGTTIHDPSMGTATPTAKTSRISAQFFELLYEELGRSIETVSPPDSVGVDGISYYFELDGRCARAWSPRPDSRNMKLVELIESLVEFAEVEARRPSIQNEQITIGKLRAIPPLN